ncbi:MAG: lytic murein transglycosylase, partial [Gammaproteobacteria bacterium]|nr:lytic murein transglycosylase [Gammaproteobacteria bacterium]
VGKWQAKQPLLIKLSLSTKQQKSLDDIMANKNVKYTDLQQLKIKIPSTITQDMRIRIVRLEKSENEFEYLLGYNNYLSIFSYNPRDNYAMAVATLAESIQNQLT